MVLFFYHMESWDSRADNQAQQHVPLPTKPSWWVQRLMLEGCFIITYTQADIWGEDMETVFFQRAILGQDLVLPSSFSHGQALTWFLLELTALDTPNSPWFIELCLWASLFAPHKETPPKYDSCVPSLPATWGAGVLQTPLGLQNFLSRFVVLVVWLWTHEVI